MEWDPNERDAWVADAQRWIKDIIGVIDCKIELNPAGEVTGVHVIATQARDPRHIVRDVESMFKTRCDLDVYYKKIGVVQVMDGPSTPDQTGPQVSGALREDSGVTFHPPGPVPASEVESDVPLRGKPATRPGSEPTADAGVDRASPETAESQRPPVPAVLVAEGLTNRLVLGGVALMASETTLKAEIQLRSGEVEASGSMEGSNHAGGEVELIARATLEAVGRLVCDPVLLHLREVRLRRLGGERVAMVAVDLTEGRRTETLFGTCSTRHNQNQAIVYAVLDALNRRLSLMSLKTSTGDA